MYTRSPALRPVPSLAGSFGIRGAEQLVSDYRTVASHLFDREKFIVGLSSAGLLRPDLSLPAYARLVPRDGVAPIFNFFDRIGGGFGFRQAVTRDHCRDYRGGRLSYDEHDGTDFVCPPGTPLVAAAPGVVVATRDNWLRGGLTVCVDHGEGIVTQYTHCAGLLAEVGQPVARGEVVALSGSAGIDMTQFFPWVPPHVHFMVWVRGWPVDPYLADGEAPRPGTWHHGNDPRAALGPLEGDPKPLTVSEVKIHEEAVERAIPLCRDARIRAELEEAPSAPARVAILEDSLHHDRDAWPDEARSLRLRPRAQPAKVRLTLPLPASIYRGARAADSPLTRPPR